MTAEQAVEAKDIAYQKDNTTKDESKQFGEESSLDKVALNNKVCYRCYFARVIYSLITLLYYPQGVIH